MFRNSLQIGSELCHPAVASGSFGAMDATRTPTPLHARAADTRQTILDSAVALYLSRGTENTTVSAIIRGARVGRTTFYRYFRDADDVLNQAVIRDYEVLMDEFETQRYEHPGLDEQLIEDMIWFIRQFRRRPALKLLFADNSRQLYERVDEALAGASRAALACSRPTYERARRQGRLRDGITLHKYVEWCMFIVMSLHTVNFPFAGNEFRLREMLKDFVVPSLIVTEENDAATPRALDSKPTVERLFGRDG